MLSRWIPLTALFVAATCAPKLHADIVACSPQTAPGVICLTGVVTDTNGSGPLVSGQVYHIFGINVPIGQTLTIESGAIVKFNNNADISVGGTVNIGAATLTSIKDDTVGGDTNGDGATLPDAGDWGGVFVFNSSSSTVAGAQIRYAADGLRLFGSDITVTDCVISDCSQEGIDCLGTSRPIVVGCNFQRCGRPIDGAALAGLPFLTGNTSSECEDSDELRVREAVVDVNTLIDPVNTMNTSGIFELCVAATIPEDITLTIAPGMIVKFSVGDVLCSLSGFDVFGTLLADGTQFTSLYDDTIGGDTNKDGGATVPAPANWGRFVFAPSSDASVLEGCSMHYAGGGVPPVGACIALNSADITLDGVTVTNCSGAGMTLTNNSFPTVTGCNFFDNARTPVENVPINAVPGFSGNVAADNLTGDYMPISDGFLLDDMTLGIDNSFNGTGLFVNQSLITVPASLTLTVAPGVTLKMEGIGNFSIAGTLLCPGTVDDPIVFTSIHDDSVLGDTANDGATVGQAGDWRGLAFFNTSSSSSLSGCHIIFGGNTPAEAAVACNGANITIQNCTIEEFTVPAVDLDANSFPVIDNCLFVSTTLPIRQAHIASVSQFTNNEAFLNTDGDVIEISEGDVDAVFGNVSIDAANSLNEDGVFLVSDAVDIAESAQLSIGGGVILKMSHNGAVTVNGHLLAAGTIAAPVVFTRVEDDTIGGDTTKDGPGAPTPGDWIGFIFGATSDGSVLDHALIRYGGRVFFESVSLSAADIQLQNCTIRDGLGDALHLGGGSFPVVVGCHFELCTGIAVNGVPFGALDGFAQNTAAFNTIGDYQRVTNGGLGSDLFVDCTMAINEGPIVLATNIDVLAGVTCTLDGGTLFKWEGFDNFETNGTLNLTANADVPVVFTSIHDDVVGGDTNKNADSSAPAPGDWHQFIFQGDSDDSVVQGLVCRYGGAVGDATVRLINSDLKLLDSTIFLGLGDALDLSNNSHPEVRRCSFDDCSQVAVDRAAYSAIAGFTDNTAGGNGTYDSIRITQTFSTAEATIEKRNSLNCDGVFVIAGSSGVSNLTLHEGVIFKFQGGNLSFAANGRLDLLGTGLEPVVFTSIHDDSIAGDTNTNGDATTPAAGDWRGLTFNQTTDASRSEYVLLRYAGAFNDPGFRGFSDQLQAKSVRVEHCIQRAFQFSRHDGPLDNIVAFACGGRGIDLTGGTFDIRFATITACGGVGIGRNASHNGVITSSILFGNTNGATIGFDLGEVFFSNAGPAFAGADGNIDVDPRFVDPGTGNLDLAEASKCIDTADTNAGRNVIRDHRESSRILDDDLNGTFWPDMGAHERAPYRLTFSGKPKVGETLTFTVHGPPGFATVHFGVPGPDVFLPPFGFRMLTPLGPPVRVRVGEPATLLLDDGEPLAAVPDIVVQALATPEASHRGAAFTNRYRGRVVTSVQLDGDAD